MTTMHLSEGEEPQEPRRWGLLIVGVIVVALAVFAGYRLLMLRTDARERDASGHCLLRARLYTFGEGQQQPRRIFGMQNMDETDWNDVQIAISGVVTAGSNTSTPTGVYTQKLPEYDSSVPAHKSREVPLDDFQSGDGPRWVAMSMRVTHAKVTAKIAGETCTYEGDLPGQK